MKLILGNTFIDIMLAVKLHKEKKPFLGAKSYLIPIINWKKGKTQIKNWVTLLNDHGGKNPNNRINYISLAKIPDDHPEFISCDWSIKK